MLLKMTETVSAMPFFNGVVVIFQTFSGYIYSWCLLYNITFFSKNNAFRTTNLQPISRYERPWFEQAPLSQFWC